MKAKRKQIFNNIAIIEYNVIVKKKYIMQLIKYEKKSSVTLKATYTYFKLQIEKFNLPIQI